MIEIGSTEIFESTMKLPKVKIKIGKSLIYSHNDSVFGDKPIIVYRFDSLEDLEIFKNLVLQFNNIIK